jgi:hypothetical protein
MMHLLLVVLFLEVGFVLVVLPWSPWWDRNYFAQSLPQVHAFITSNFTRGAVSGLGIVNLLAGLVDLVSVILSRRSREPVVHIVPPRRQAEE